MKFQLLSNGFLSIKLEKGLGNAFCNRHIFQIGCSFLLYFISIRIIFPEINGFGTMSSNQASNLFSSPPTKVFRGAFHHLFDLVWSSEKNISTTPRSSSFYIVTILHCKYTYFLMTGIWDKCVVSSSVHLVMF